MVVYRSQSYDVSSFAICLAFLVVLQLYSHNYIRIASLMRANVSLFTFSIHLPNALCVINTYVQLI